MDVPLWCSVIIQIVLIFVNAFFACAEIAVISLNENKLKKSAEDGDRKAAQMLKTVQSPTGFLSTIQVCITLAGFLASAFAAESFADDLALRLSASLPNVSVSLISTLCLIAITLILSFITLIFGELVPKRIAMANTQKVAYAVFSTVSVAQTIMKPIVWLLTVCTNAVLRLFGIDSKIKDEEVTEDDIRMMVDIGEETGNIEAAQKDMIENVFEFNDITASDIMVHRTNVQAISIDDTDDEIYSLIEETGMSRFPVYGEDLDEVLGILNAKRFLMDRHKGKATPVKDLLLPAYFVTDMVHADVLFRDMQKKKESFAILVDEYGGMSGIVTMEDLLEEIVGNIYDEFDPQPETEFEKLSDDTWRIAGNATLEELAEHLDWEIPETDEFDTLGGLIYSVLTEIPKDTDTPQIEAYGLQIKVEKIEDRHIEKAVVKKIQNV